MTVQELHILFKVLLDKVDTEYSPDFQKSEIDLFLNEAQERLVKQRYGINNIYQKGLEQSQKRIDDLRTLHKTLYKGTSPIEDGIASIELQNFFKNDLLSISDDSVYWFLTRLEVYLKKVNCGVGRYVEPVYNKVDSIVKNDPFNKPKSIFIYYTFENGRIYLYHDNKHTLDKVRISFIKKPNKISIVNNLSSELPDHLHSDLVYTAVQIALETIESPRTQTNQAININNLE